MIKSPTLRNASTKWEAEIKRQQIIEARWKAQNQQVVKVESVPAEIKPAEIKIESTPAPKVADQRSIKATELVLGDRFIQSDKGSWYCQSQSNPDKLYMVSPNHCTCPDHQYRKVECKHIRGYRVLIERLDREAIELKRDLGW